MQGLFIPFHLLDVPRLVIGSKGVPITNQSHAKNESGAYLLPSLQFTTEATVEAWEVYAESPGRIQLQVRLCFSPHEPLSILQGAEIGFVSNHL